MTGRLAVWSVEVAWKPERVIATIQILLVEDPTATLNRRSATPSHVIHWVMLGFILNENIRKCQFSLFFSVVLSYYNPVLDGFDWHNQPSVHSINLSNTKIKILGNGKNRTWSCWMRSKYATSVPCSALSPPIIFSLSTQSSVGEKHFDVAVIEPRSSCTQATILSITQWLPQLLNFKENISLK